MIQIIYKMNVGLDIERLGRERLQRKLSRIEFAMYKLDTYSDNNSRIINGSNGAFYARMKRLMREFDQSCFDYARRFDGEYLEVMYKRGFRIFRKWFPRYSFSSVFIM